MPSWCSRMCPHVVWNQVAMPMWLGLQTPKRKLKALLVACIFRLCQRQIFYHSKASLYVVTTQQLQCMYVYMVKLHKPILKSTLTAQQVLKLASFVLGTRKTSNCNNRKNICIFKSAMLPDTSIAYSIENVQTCIQCT